MKAFDQRLCFRVGLWIEHLPRMTVAAEKPLQSKHIAVPAAADDHRSTGSRLEQADATQYQGAHDPLAQLCLRDQQCPQLVPRDGEGPPPPSRPAPSERWPAGEVSKLPHERPRAVRHDGHAVAQSVASGDLDLPSKDNGQPGTDLAYFRQRRPGLIRADVAESTHALDLERLQNGKHLVASSVEDRWRGRHDPGPSARGGRFHQVSTTRWLETGREPRKCPYRRFQHRL